MNFSIEAARGTDSSRGVDDVLMVGARSTLGEGGGNVFGSQTNIACRKGVTDESAVVSVVEIEGWRLPRERRDVYDADEVRVGSNQTGGRGAMTVVKSQMSIEGPAVILLAFRPARGGGVVAPKMIVLESREGERVLFRDPVMNTLIS